MAMTDEKMLLVLDLDETLIHSKESREATDYDFLLFRFKVYLRPFLAEFLHDMSTHYRMAIWSSASDRYVDEMVKQIIPAEMKLEFAWGRSMCTLSQSPAFHEEARESHHNFVKKLKKVEKLGFSLNRTLIVDDSPEKCVYNHGNAIYPTPFEGDRSDRELLLLRDYLIELSKVENVRTIEKRHWRNQTK